MACLMPAKTGEIERLSWEKLGMHPGREKPGKTVVAGSGGRGGVGLSSHGAPKAKAKVAIVEQVAKSPSSLSGFASLRPSD